MGQPLHPFIDSEQSSIGERKLELLWVYSPEPALISSIVDLNSVDSSCRWKRSPRSDPPLQQYNWCQPVFLNSKQSPSECKCHKKPFKSSLPPHPPPTLLFLCCTGFCLCWHTKLFLCCHWTSVIITILMGAICWQPRDESLSCTWLKPPNCFIVIFIDLQEMLVEEGLKWINKWQNKLDIFHSTNYSNLGLNRSGLT